MATVPYTTEPILMFTARGCEASFIRGLNLTLLRTLSAGACCTAAVFGPCTELSLIAKNRAINDSQGSTETHDGK